MVVGNIIQFCGGYHRFRGPYVTKGRSWDVTRGVEYGLYYQGLEIWVGYSLVEGRGRSVCNVVCVVRIWRCHHCNPNPNVCPHGHLQGPIPMFNRRRLDDASH